MSLSHVFITCLFKKQGTPHLLLFSDQFFPLGLTGLSGLGSSFSLGCGDLAVELFFLSELLLHVALLQHPVDRVTRFTTLHVLHFVDQGRPLSIAGLKQTKRHHAFTVNSLLSTPSPGLFSLWPSGKDGGAVLERGSFVRIWTLTMYKQRLRAMKTDHKCRKMKS